MINCKVYPLDPKQQVAMRKWLDNMLERGYLHPSKSPITSSMFYIPKKDGDDHPVQDYHILNKYTVKDNSPLPNIKQTIADLVQVFVLLNLTSGGGTTMSKSRRVTSGRQRSKPHLVYLNQQ